MSFKFSEAASYQRSSLKIGALKNFTKFTEEDISVPESLF